MPHVTYVQYPVAQNVNSQQRESEERARAEASIEAHKEEVEAMMHRVLNPEQISDQVFPQLPAGSVVVNENAENLQMLGVDPLTRSCPFDEER